jgi:hypothetical protein
MTYTGVSEKEPPYPDEMGDSTYHYDYPFVSSGEGVGVEILSIDWLSVGAVSADHEVLNSVHAKSSA